jgi:Ni/Co efflux regulator RcnB
MKCILFAAAAIALLASSGAAIAQPRHDDHGHGPSHGHGPAMAMHGPSHPTWRQGGHIASSDWRRGSRVDYRSHHLRPPPRGYEWRQVDGNYVLAAVATGLIASVILAGH